MSRWPSVQEASRGTSSPGRRRSGHLGPLWGFPSPGLESGAHTMLGAKPEGPHSARGPSGRGQGRFDRRLQQKLISARTHVGGAGRNRDPSKISSKKGALRSFPQWNRDPHIFSKYECQRPGMKRPG